MRKAASPTKRKRQTKLTPSHPPRGATGQATSDRAPSDQAVTSTTAGRWTFLTNHSHVLALLHAAPEMTLREVAGRVGITERAVQRIVQDLEEGGFIVRERVGRRNHYQVLTDAALRHPIEAHRTIGDLLRLVNEGREPTG